MENDCIIVLGSGDPVKIPDINATEIYSSNGSAELAARYKKKYSNTLHTCVIGARPFLKLGHVKPRVIKAKPDNIVIRDFQKASYLIIKDMFENKSNLIKFTRKQQFFFQKIFFNSGLIDLFKAELHYEEKMFKKINHFIKFYFSNDFMGVSSGFFAILYAAHKYPNSKIIVSGIGFEGGEHYYKSGMMTFNRGRVDNYLIKKLKKDVKKKIFVLDKNISNKFDLNYLNSKLLI